MTPTPQAPAVTPDPWLSATKKDDDDDDKGKKDPKKDGPVRTQMVGEAPGEDLGYDPDSIPTEPIEDD